MKQYSWLIVVAALVLLLVPVLVLAQDYSVHLSQIDNAEFPEVTVYVNVTDGTGAQVIDRTQEDFTIWEDEEQGDIVDFAGLNEERPADVVFVFDTTSSMREEIDGLKQTAIDFAFQLRENNRDFRLGLITFSDRVEGRFNNDGSLTADELLFRDWVSGLQAEGGGDGPENAFGAIKDAVQMQFRPEAQVVFILITDAPPHRVGDAQDEGVDFDDPDLEIKPILELLKEEAVTVFPVAYDDVDFRQLAAETGGNFYDINTSPDFTGIIDEIGITIASQYKITYLSPRPVPDGTVREVKVGVNNDSGAMAMGTGSYLEEHLLYIQSSWLIGLLLLVPLIGALIIPSIYLARAPKSVPPGLDPAAAVPQPDWNQQPLPPPVDFHQPPLAPPQAISNVNESICSSCGAQNRSGAKFCSQCRQALAPIEETNCPRCQSSLRASAHFCQSCGYKVGG